MKTGQECTRREGFGEPEARGLNVRRQREARREETGVTAVSIDTRLGGNLLRAVPVPGSAPGAEQ